MKRIVVFVGLLIVQLTYTVCTAQSLSRNVSATDSVPYGLKPQEWIKLQEIWARRNLSAKVLLSDGNSLEGQIVYLHNDTLVLHLEALTFINQFVGDNQIIHLHRDSIVNIAYSPELLQRLMESGLFWGTTAGIAAGTGLYIAGGGWVSPAIIVIPGLLGAGIGLPIDLRKRRMMEEPDYLDLNSDKARKKYVLFPDQLPGLSAIVEYSPMVTSQIFADANFDDLINASPKVSRVFGAPAISISGHAGQTSIAKKDKSIFGVNFGFSITYRPITKLKFGYLFSEKTTWGKPLYEYFDGSSSLYFQEDAYIVSHTLFAKYVPLAANPFLTRRIETSAGIGASFYKLHYSSKIMTIEWNNLAFEDNTSNNIGLTFMSDFDFYVFRNFSIYLSINKSINKPFKPKDLSAKHPVTSEDIFYETMEIYPSPLDIVIGLRFHFLRR